MASKEIPEDVVIKLRTEASIYTKRQGHHDNPDTTAHDFFEGSQFGYSLATQEVAAALEGKEKEIAELKEELRKQRARANYGSWVKFNYQYDDYDDSYCMWSQKSGVVPFSGGIKEMDIRKRYIKENNL